MGLDWGIAKSAGECGGACPSGRGDPAPKLIETAELFLANEKRRLSREAFLRVKSMVANVVRFFGETATINSISAIRVKEFADQRLQVATRNSVRLELSALKRILSLANDGYDGYVLSANPVEAVKLPSLEQINRYAMTRQEFRRLLGACHPWLQPIVQFAVFTGLRRGVLLKLRWEQLNEAQTSIVLPASRSGTGRCIPLNKQARKLLAMLQAGQANPTGLIFRLRGLTEASASQAFTRACRSVGIRGYSFKDLRETAARWMIEDGVRLEAVAEFLGHKNLSILNRYIGLRPSELTDAVEVLGHGLVAPKQRRTPNSSIMSRS